YPGGPLAAGDALPPLEVEGWLNGPPPALGPGGPRVTVVDIWAFWCPGCRETAPGLVQIYHKTKDRGVAFVSLTNMPRANVEQCVEQFDVPWPCAYGATSQTIARLGAYNHGMTTPGYEVKLTLYVVGTDNRVLWCDGHGRLAHVDRGPQLKQLEEQIERALAV